MHVHPIRNKTSLELWPLNIGNINISIGGGEQNICTDEEKTTITDYSP